MNRVLVFSFLLFCPLLGWAQVHISGEVTDRTNGDALLGVSVVVVANDGSIGTITDMDGKFSLDVPNGAILRFSYIGYTSQDVIVKKSDFLHIALAEDMQKIEEVVVVGAAMKKSDLTGSVARITEDKLKELPTANLNQALQGKISGVYIEANPRPGANASIQIRGNNSITYGTSPLYVIDNIMIDDTDISTINPDDIASIDVLKDASATALYGARGANGVVLITTKRGKKGQGKVTYDMWFGSQSFSKEMEMLSASNLFDLRVDAYANAYMDNNPTKDRQKYIDGYLTVSGNKAARNVAFSKTELEAYENGADYNWLNEVTRQGFQHNHSVSFSGGSDKGNYFLSFGYNNQKGQMVNTGYERYSGKVNLEHKVKDWLKIGTNNSLSYSIENPVGNDNTFITALTASPLLPISEDYWYMWEGKVENQSSSNPLRDLYIQKDVDKLRVLSSNYVNINPIKGLDIRSTFSVDIAQQENDTYYPTNTTQSYKSSYNGQAVQYRTKSLHWQWDNTISYNTLIAEKHKVSAVAGMNMSYYGNNWNQVNAAGFGNDLFGYKNLSGATDKEQFYLYSGYTSYSLMSYFARANYVYDSRYYLTLTGRFDGSSKFGPTHKWGFFPSVAASWNVTGENFMKEQHIFDNLRLRVGYGLVGNQNIPNYGYQTLFSPTTSLDSYVLTNDGTYGNADLRWETQKQWNLGIDIGVWKNRLNMNIDLFHITNEDLLMERTMAPTAGYSTKLDNVGCMENKGIEFSCNLAAVKTNHFQWNIAFNIAADKNKITSLYDNVTEIYNLGGYSNNEIQRTGNLFLGQSVNNIYVFQFDRIVQEEDMDYVNSLDLGSRVVRPGDILPVDRDGNGIINDNDRYVIGKTDPDFYGGFTTDFSYRGIELKLIATYSVGAQRISYLYETLMSSYGTRGAHADLLNRWTPENTNTNIPRAYSEGGRFALSEVDWGVQDASFLKLSAVTLAYNLPTSWMHTIHFEKIRLYATGNNLFTWTKYKGYDPESGDWYPSSRMFVFGLDIVF